MHGQNAKIDDRQIHFFTRQGTLQGLAAWAERARRELGHAAPRQFSGGLTTYAIELFGFRASDKTHVNYFITLEQDLVRKFFDLKNLPQVDLMSWLMGDWSALNLPLSISYVCVR